MSRLRPSREQQGLGALLWLRSRELLGESRDTSRLYLLGLLLVGWVLLSREGAALAWHQASLTRDHVGYLAAGAWPLWALLPLLGGGGGEVVASQRLAAFPVGPGAVFGAAWLTAFLDVPYLIIAPLLISLNGFAFGPSGVAATVCFTVGASGLGQLAAWTSSLVLAGRRRSGLTALLLTGGVIGLLAVAPRILPAALGVSTVLPSGWLDAAERAAIQGRGGLFLTECALLAAPAVVALFAGPRLTRLALDREGRAGGVGERSWGRRGWWVRGGMVRALTVAALRSMTRAVGAQVALAGVLTVPAIAHLPGVSFAQVSLPAMGTVAAVAAAVVLGINAFAFDAGGAALLFSLPIPPRQVLLARMLAVGGCLAAAQLAVTAVGVASTHPTGVTAAVALGLDACRTLALAGLGLVWSLAMPAASDYDSLRARVAPPRSVLTFGLAAAVVSYGSTQVVHDLGAMVGLLLVFLVSTLIAIGCLDRAERMALGGATERVVAAVTR
ncbi:MAG: hypothetical protein ACYDB7_09180 [Mycobacteriales bacterium]